MFVLVGGVCLVWSPSRSLSAYCMSNTDCFPMMSHQSLLALGAIIDPTLHLSIILSNQILDSLDSTP